MLADQSLEKHSGIVLHQRNKEIVKGRGGKRIMDGWSDGQIVAINNLQNVCIKKKTKLFKQID